MNQIILNAEEVLLVKKTNLVREYREDAKEGFKGKKYRIYAYGDKAFAVHEDDDFHEDLASGNIQKIMLTSDNEGQISLANYVTWNKAIAQRKNQLQFDMLTVENYKLSVESLKDLANQTID